jgi:hypothetical protein
MDLRAQIETDLGDTLEGDFGLPVTLISPAGESVTVRGQVAYDTREYDPITGAEMIIDLPVVTVRRSSLSTIPADGEIWAVRIPSTPSVTGTLETYVLSDRPIKHGRSYGWITLYLTKAEQSV